MEFRWTRIFLVVTSPVWIWLGYKAVLLLNNLFEATAEVLEDMPRAFERTQYEELYYLGLIAMGLLTLILIVRLIIRHWGE